MKVLKELKGMKASRSSAVDLAAAAGGLASEQKGRRNTSRNVHLGLVFLRLFCSLAPGFAGQPDRRAHVRFMSFITFTAFMFSGGT